MLTLSEDGNRPSSSTKSKNKEEHNMELENYITINNVRLIIQDMSGNRVRIRYSFVSKHNEKIDVELTTISCENNHLVKIWQKKYGALKRQKNYIAVDVYVTDEKGNCWGKYNPQVGNSKLDFAWMLKDTVENRKKILGEIIRRANEESTTEEK